MHPCLGDELGGARYAVGKGKYASMVLVISTSFILRVFKSTSA